MVSMLHPFPLGYPSEWGSLGHGSSFIKGEKGEGRRGDVHTEERDRAKS